MIAWAVETSVGAQAHTSVKKKRHSVFVFCARVQAANTSRHREAIRARANQIPGSLIRRDRGAVITEHADWKCVIRTSDSQRILHTQPFVSYHILSVTNPLSSSSFSSSIFHIWALLTLPVSSLLSQALFLSCSSVVIGRFRS
jgi:hypothetical protein